MARRCGGVISMCRFNFPAASESGHEGFILDMRPEYYKRKSPTHEQARGFWAITRRPLAKKKNTRRPVRGVTSEESKFYQEQQ